MRKLAILLVAPLFFACTKINNDPTVGIEGGESIADNGPVVTAYIGHVAYNITDPGPQYTMSSSGFILSSLGVNLLTLQNLYAEGYPWITGPFKCDRIQVGQITCNNGILYVSPEPYLILQEAWIDGNFSGSYADSTGNLVQVTGTFTDIPPIKSMQ